MTRQWDTSTFSALRAKQVRPAAKRSRRASDGPSPPRAEGSIVAEDWSGRALGGHVIDADDVTDLDGGAGRNWVDDER